MGYFEKEKRLLANRTCCKKVLSKTGVNRRLEERKKYGQPGHLKTIDEWKHHATTALTKTENKLESKRIFAVEKIKNLVNQWKNLTLKELEFKRVVENFNESTIQMRQKMEREKAKRNTMRQQVLTKQKAINRIRKANADFSYVIDQLRKETQKHIKYEDFLDQFTERCQFRAIGEVLQRYAVLFNTREDVLLKLENTHRKSLHYKAEYEKFLHRCDEESVKLSYVLTQQTKKYDEIQRQVRQKEAVVRAVKCNMQRLWNEINTTRDAMQHVVCLLLVRLNPGVPPNIMCDRENLQYLLTTETGNLSYVKKRLGDIEKVRLKMHRLIDEKKRSGASMASEEIEWWRRFSKPREMSFTSIIKSSKRESYQDIRMATEIPIPTSKTYPRFPQISSVTAKTLEEIRTAISSARKWDKAKRKAMKTDSDSEDTSISVKDSVPKDRSSFQPIVSDKKKSKTLSTWEFLREIGNMTDEELIRTIAYLEPIDGKLHKPDDKADKVYTCASLTTDPLGKMQIEKQINSRSRRILERNFDRYEKKFKNPLRQNSSSVLKINKETGNLELPKLKVSKYQLPSEIKEYLARKEARRARMEAMLPQIAERMSKIPRRVKLSKLYTSPRKYSKTKKLPDTDQPKVTTFEDLNAFLHIPAIISKYKTDNL